MAGKTPTQAFDAFIQPIQTALGCVGTGKITLSPAGRSPGGVRAWTINGGQGLVLKDGWHLEGEMHYEIVKEPDPVRGPWRVTTRAYRYRVAHCGNDIARLHWHPAGKSPYTKPHLHLPQAGEAEKGHLPVGRLTFEDAVEWTITLSAQEARTDWRSVLDASRQAHTLHRSWH